jgi:hypothetical protein
LKRLEIPYIVEHLLIYNVYKGYLKIIESINMAKQKAKKYRMSQEEGSISWEVILSVILTK